MNYFEKWAESILSLPSLRVSRNITVQGSYKKHLGPRLEYAVVDIVASPSDELIVEVSDKLSRLDSYSQELIHSAILGILDVILIGTKFPLREVKITLVDADIHPVDSNIAAFRNAGRHAGRMLLVAIES